MSELRERLAKLPASRRAEILSRLGAASAGPELVPRTRAGTVPASYAQRTLWFLDRLAPGDTPYNTGMTFAMTGRLDGAALGRAFAAVVARHESLRTELDDGPDGPVQRVLSKVDLDLTAVEVAGADEAARMTHAKQIALADTRRSFDLKRGPLWRARLLRLSPTHHVLVLVVHHVAVDGWSIGVLTADLAAFYRAEIGETDERPEPLSLQYADYAEWQREWLTGQVRDDLVAYWRETLASSPVVELPTDRPRPAQMTYRGSGCARMLSRDLVDGTETLARAAHTTSFTVYLAAFFVLIHRYTGLDDIVIGSPSASRGRVETEPLIGFFANMLVLRTDLSGDPTVREVLRRVQEVVRGAIAHGDLPFERLVDALRPRRDPSRSPLFQVGFTAEEAADPLTLPGLTVESEFVEAGSSRFDMSWWVTSHVDGLHVGVEYNVDLYDRPTVEQLVHHYEVVLRGMLAEPDRCISRLALLSAHERDEMITRWNGPRVPIPPISVTAAFEERVRATPGAVALVVGDTEYTYDELNRRANRIADRLRSGGAGPGRRVALCLRRDVDLIASVLAVLKTGAAYVPIDATYPPARIAVILDDAAPLALLTHAVLTGGLPATASGVLVLDELTADLADRPDGDQPGVASPSDVAYVMYTSGTTGRPKGALIEHHSVIGFVAAMRDLFKLMPADRVLGFASPNFDVFVGEMFMALLIGGRLCLAQDEDRLSMDRLQRLMETARVTVTDLPPAVMALLRPERLPDLRIVFVGGELFAGELVNRWNPGRRFFNGYGPTECTVTMVVHECAGRWQSSPPIGLPIANHVAHVVDRHLEPVPYGVAGELLIGGEGLTRGYLNAPQLTDEKVVRDPFGSTADGRLYHTGDLVRRQRDGSIMFLGRIDHQVKIRGLRIELSEIETVLATRPGIDQVAVAVWTDDRGEKHLVAYVTATAGVKLEPSLLRAHVSEHLPAHMIPTYWVMLESLPLTISGKVDRRVLPEPDASALATTVGEARPTTETERVLADEILAGILRLDRVGVTDDFFALGGNSLQAAQLMSRITSTFGVEVSLADFFSSPTVVHLAATIDRLTALTVDDDDLLARIEQMSDAEAALLLKIESRS